MRHSNSIAAKGIAVGVAAAMLSIATPALADESSAEEAGLGAASAAATLVYGPVKVAYSLMGIVFGGLAYGLSGGDSDVMDAVITPAIRGDYVITPTHLRGERGVEFFGRRAEDRAAQPADAVVMEDSYEGGY